MDYKINYTEETCKTVERIEAEIRDFDENQPIAKDNSATFSDLWLLLEWITNSETPKVFNKNLENYFWRKENMLIEQLYDLFALLIKEKLKELSNFN